MGQRSLNCIPEAAEEEASGPTVDHTLSVYLINDFNLTKAQEPGSATSVETPREAGSQDLRWLHSSGIKFLNIKSAWVGKCSTSFVVGTRRQAWLWVLTFHLV